MIPGAYIQEWSSRTPWPDPRHVEQDLIISRALRAWRSFRVQCPDSQSGLHNHAALPGDELHIKTILRVRKKTAQGRGTVNLLLRD
jgi:hypothetical protein